MSSDIHYIIKDLQDTSAALQDQCARLQEFTSFVLLNPKASARDVQQAALRLGLLVGPIGHLKLAWEPQGKTVLYQ